jgi:predicted transcriptional regulator YdeE
MSDIRAVEHPGLTAIGLIIEAKWSDLPRAVPASWNGLFSRRHEIAAPPDSQYAEISIARRDGVYTEFVGVIVAADVPAVPGMVRLELPPNRYLGSTHRGALADIAASFGSIYAYGEAAGLPLADLKLDFGYDAGMRPGQHELFVAVTPARSPVWN